MPVLAFLFPSFEFHHQLCHNHYSDSHQCRPCQLLTLHMSLSKARQCSGAVVSSIILKGEIISALFLATDYGGMMANSLTLCCQKSYPKPKQIFLLKWLKILFLTTRTSWTKGQLISKCIFCVFTFFQKMSKNKLTSSKVEFVHLFFGRNVGLKKSF